MPVCHAVLIGGYAGVGKSRLGHLLARRTGWAILDKDTLTRSLAEAALEAYGRPPHDRESATYLNKVRPREYEVLADTLTENLSHGTSVIAIAPYLRELTNPQWIGRTQAAITGHGASLTVVWVDADPNTMRNNLRARGAARDAAKLADWPTYLAGLDPNRRPAIDYVRIDNSRTRHPEWLDDQADALRKRLHRT